MSEQIAKQQIGILHGVEIALVAWDGADAEVDLSCACMFSHELGKSEPIGGLAHLNQALDNALLNLRQGGQFKAEKGETLFITLPSSEIKAKCLLVIGMGNPEQWSVQSSADAVAVALRTAQQHQFRSVAFAPSLLDSGVEIQGDLDAAMLKALKKELEAQIRISELGLNPYPKIEYWSFDAGLNKFDEKAQRFKQAFADLNK